MTDTTYRTVDQMVQAARSGRQNIAEGSQASAVSPGARTLRALAYKSDKTYETYRIYLI